MVPVYTQSKETTQLHEHHEAGSHFRAYLPQYINAKRSTDFFAFVQRQEMIDPYGLEYYVNC